MAALPALRQAVHLPVARRPAEERPAIPAPARLLRLAIALGPALREFHGPLPARHLSREFQERG